MPFFSRFPGLNTFLEAVFQYHVIALKVNVKFGMLASFFALNLVIVKPSNSYIIIIIVNIYMVLFQ